MAYSSSDYYINSGYGYGSVNSMDGMITWLIISAVIAVLGGLILYFTFLSKKNDGRFKGFWGWTYEFLHFKKFTIEAILKITYLISMLFITLGSFSLIGTSFAAFIAMLLLGNLALRISYEFLLVLLVICRNTTEINNKLNKKDE